MYADTHAVNKTKIVDDQQKSVFILQCKKYIGQNGILRLHAGDEKATAYHKHWHWHEAKL